MQKRNARIARRVLDERMNTRRFCFYCLHPAKHLIFNSQIYGVKRAVPIEFPGQLLTARDIHIAEEDLGALRMKGAHGRLTDAIGSTGDNDRLPA